MFSFIFLLISSFFHALWNSLLKRQIDSKIILFQAVVVATLLAWILVFINQDFNYGEALKLTLIAGVIEGLYFITVTLALAQAPIALSYSIMRALSMLMTWLLSYIALKEQISVMGAIGVFSILIGLSLPIIQKNKSVSSHDRYFWSYICAFTIVGYNFFYNRALQLNISPLLLFATSLSIALPILFISLKKNEKKKILNFNFKENHYKISLVIGAVLLLSFSTFLYGLKDTLPAIAITIRNASIPFALILSALIGEKLKKSDYTILIFILFGVFIVSAVSI